MKKPIKITKSDIVFDIGQRHISFSLYHNLPETHGLSMKDAVTNWVYRTKDYSPESLISYIEAKQTGYIVLSETQYNNLHI